ncbi:MAG: tetratricopeptide repeat protein [Saprospiraceae bacterium]|nr:tetratricopeptide repeat protein [Saprospiraceae bacterium]
MSKNKHPAIRFFAAALMAAALGMWPGAVFSQKVISSTDSLLQLLSKALPDSNKVNLLNELAWQLKLEDYDRAVIYLDSALGLSRKLGFKIGEGNALNFRGVVEDIHGNSDAAVQFFEKALAIRKAIGDKKGVASLYNNIGNVNENQGDYPAALANYQQSLRLREELGDTVRMMNLYYNIGNLHEAMGNYIEALDYIFQYLEAAEKRKDEEGVANAWNIIGNIKIEVDRFEEAYDAFEKSLDLHRKLGNDWQIATVLINKAVLNDAIAEDRMEANELGDTVLNLFGEAISLQKEALQIREKLGDVKGQSDIYNNIGYILKNLGSFYKTRKELSAANKTWQEAEEYLFRSLEFRQKDGNKKGIAEVYNGISDVRRRQKRYEEALDYTQKYYAIAKEINDEKYQQNALKDLARIHYNLGRYKLAYEYREQYDELRYARFNQERIKTVERREAVYTDNKKKFEIERQQHELRLRDAQLENAATIRNSLLGGGALLLLLAGVLFNRNKVIRSEKQRSENLLLNILPAQTAEELKKFGRAKARSYEAVTVLFTDFQSFTTIAEKTSPEVLVAQLDKCFQAFDDIISKYGIEKIKTIGDAYLCASGLPVPNTIHAEVVVSAAIEMQAFMENFRGAQQSDGHSPFYCRIGIHTGPVVAGVVGKKKFAYDIWGDTVNVAARMEQSSEANRVNISQRTYELVKSKFRCTHRGKIRAKNKGEMDMYFVEA